MSPKQWVPFPALEKGGKNMEPIVGSIILPPFLRAGKRTHCLGLGFEQSHAHQQSSLQQTSARISGRCASRRPPKMCSDTHACRHAKPLAAGPLSLAAFSGAWHRAH